MYEIHSKFLKQLLTCGGTYYHEHSFSLSGSVIIKIGIKLILILLTEKHYLYMHLVQYK